MFRRKIVLMAFLLPFLLPLCSHTAQVYIRCHTVSNKTIFYDMKRCHPMKTKNIPLEFLHLNYQRALPPFNYLAEIFNGILLIKIKQQIFILFFCHSILTSEKTISKRRLVRILIHFFSPFLLWRKWEQILFATGSKQDDEDDERSIIKVQ